MTRRFEQKYHMASIRQDSHSNSDKLIFKICVNLPFTTCLEIRYKYISIIRLGCKPLEFPVNSDTISQCTFWASVFTCSFKWLLITFAVKKPRQFRHLPLLTYYTCTNYESLFSLDCKIVRIFYVFMTRAQSNKRSGVRRVTLAQFARVWLFRYSYDTLNRFWEK